MENNSVIMRIKYCKKEKENNNPRFADDWSHEDITYDSDITTY